MAKTLVPQALPLRPRRQALACLAAVACLLTACGQAPTGTAQLADDLGCMRCHGMKTKFVGPGFAQIAQRYRTDAQASERLAAKITKGSVGDWGAVIMPRQPHVTPAQAAELAQWVLAQP